MYEITTADANKFEDFREKQRVNKNGVYAFSFENAFLIYYYKRAAGRDHHVYDYLGLDLHTGNSSNICSSKLILEEGKFHSLVPNILNSINYIGDRRSVKTAN